jgi:hypothetical protein
MLVRCLDRERNFLLLLSVLWSISRTPFLGQWTKKHQWAEKHDRGACYMGALSYFDALGKKIWRNTLLLCYFYWFGPLTQCGRCERDLSIHQICPQLNDSKHVNMSHHRQLIQEF